MNARGEDATATARIYEQLTMLSLSIGSQLEPSQTQSVLTSLSQ